MMNQAQGISGAEFGAGIADVVTVELHDATAPYAVAYTYSDINLSTTGNLSINTLPGSITGSYYVVIKHRNSIETWSKLAYDFSGVGPFAYDFSTAATQAFGDNMKSIGGVFVVYVGDVNQDGIVDGTDMLEVGTASRPPVLNGYFPQDVNGDGLVDGTDMLLIGTNSRPPVAQVQKP